MVTTIGQKSEKIFAQSIQLYFMQLLSDVDGETSILNFSTETEVTPDCVDKLLEGYKEVFEEPKTLPPTRGSMIAGYHWHLVLIQLVLDHIDIH